MAQVIQASELTLSDVENLFNLRQVLNEPNFFREWLDDLQELSQSEIEVLQYWLC